MKDSPIAFSLSEALAALTPRCRDVICDVHNLLGLSLLVTASPADDDMDQWPVLARDGFLLPAGRALGLTIRPIHPPEAAVGVERSAEFGQHFEASYAPLIRRALEHGQAVLAWQGWEDDSLGRWGVITRTDERGMGFAGTAYPATSDEILMRERVLARPAKQVYVVEEKSGARSTARQQHGMALRHCAAALQPEYGARFGVLSGGPAIRRWAAVLSKQSHEVRGRLTDAILRQSLLAGLDCLSSADTAGVDRDLEKVGAAQRDYAQELRGLMRGLEGRSTAESAGTLSQAAALTETVAARVRFLVEGKGEHHG